MPGFFVSNTSVQIDLKNLYPAWCVKEDLSVPGMTVKRHTLNKFMQDKPFEDTENGIFILDGFLLNKVELFAQYAAATVSELMWKMYQAEGETFVNAFRGSFSGALYDRAKDLWLIFTNHVGDKTIFYAATEKGLLAGSQANYLIDACKELGVTLTLDESAAYQLLSYSFIADQATLAQQIKRLRAGTYIRVEKGQVEVKAYHTFVKDPSLFDGKSEEEIIEGLDAAFRHAVELEYRKDEEYGLRYLSDMSGGLDSRMTMWIAHEMKPRHMQLITYCRANHDDEVIAKQIAAYWKDEHLIKPLDDISYIYDLDELVFMNSGLSMYSAISGGKRLLESMNMPLFGLEHTGQLGDPIIGSYCRNMKDFANHIPTGRFSETLVPRLTIDYEGMCRDYGNHELYLMYTRGFQGINNTHAIRQNYTEVTAPFLDVELLQYCMNIPIEKRLQHAIYKKWVIAKYPNAAKFRWEKTGAKITEGKLMGKLRRILVKGPRKLLRITGRAKYIQAGMNPAEYWLSKNKKARDFMDQYEATGYEHLPVEASAQLVEDMKTLYRTGTYWEKSMVLTVLAAAKLYFG